MIAWAGACVYCRRAIQRPGNLGWWEDADGGLSCPFSATDHGGHEPERPGELDDVRTDLPPWQRRATSAGWTVPEGWRFENLGQCRTCYTPVAWCWTPKGSRAPVERDGAPHFARCPQADVHRRRR